MAGDNAEAIALSESYKAFVSDYFVRECQMIQKPSAMFDQVVTTSYEYLLINVNWSVTIKVFCCHLVEWDLLIFSAGKLYREYLPVDRNDT
jgi:hypothetical protein